MEARCGGLSVLCVDQTLRAKLDCVGSAQYTFETNMTWAHTASHKAWCRRIIGKAGEVVGRQRTGASACFSRLVAWT